jgi:hypothetical protein
MSGTSRPLRRGARSSFHSVEFKLFPAQICAISIRDPRRAKVIERIPRPPERSAFSFGANPAKPAPFPRLPSTAATIHSIRCSVHSRTGQRNNLSVISSDSLQNDLPKHNRRESQTFSMSREIPRPVKIPDSQ